MTFKILDIKVKIDFFFILILISSFLAGLGVNMLSALIALFFHEFGHIMLSRNLGIKVEGIDILPFGGRIKILNLDEVPADMEMMIAIAGPMINFAVSIFLFFLVHQDMLPSQIGYHLINYQLLIGLFNMLPALPLDGGRVFVLWLRQHMNYMSSVRLAVGFSKVLSASLFGIAIIGFLMGRFYVNIIVAGFFLTLYTLKEQREAPLFFIKHVVKKKEMVHNKGLLPAEILVVVEKTDVRQLLYEFMPQKYYFICVLDNDMRIKKYLTETEIFNKILQKGLDIKVKDLI